MHISLADFGTHFSTRSRAQFIAAQANLGSGVVVLDFTGVEAVSGSFVDELLACAGEKITDIVAPESRTAARTIATVAARRGLVPAA